MNESILVVDDDLDILELLQSMLEEKGFRVVAAPTGEQAVKIAKETEFQVALLDIVLPDVRGDKLAVELKKIDKSIDIIFITGFPGFEDCINALDIGVRDILLKPITVKELLKSVNQVLLNRGLVHSGTS